MAVSVAASPGMTLGRQPSVLIDHALELLAAGPVDAQTVVARVCQLPSVAAPLADHLATALLAGDDRFTRTADGRWKLVADTRTSPAVIPSSHPAVIPSAARDLLVPGRKAARADAATRSPAAQDGGFASRYSAHPRPSFVREGRTGYDALHHTPFVVIDVETTGTRAYAGDRVTEVAAVRVSGGRAEIVFDTLINPERAIPPYISRLTSITWDMVKDAPRFRDVAMQLAGVLEGHVFVAHNATFDWRFISMEMERATGRPVVGAKLCTVKMARKLLPTLRRRSLDHVTHHFGIDITARHRAGGDAYATAQVFIRLLEHARSAGCASVAEIEQLIRPGARPKRRRRPPALPYGASDDSSA